MVTVPQDGSLVQHIQIQPLGQEITQGEAITLTLEEAQQLLQQQIVAGGWNFTTFALVTEGYGQLSS